MRREAIVKAATQMKTTHDLLVLLNKIKMEELGDKGHPFTMPQLNFFINPKRNVTRYHTFTIPKKSGGVRTISAPVGLLKSFQTYTNRILQAFYDAPECVTGFVPEKSVVDNAERHLGQNYVFNTDLKDFFPSISQARVWGALQGKPFNFPKGVASAIAGLCCIRERTNPLPPDSENEVFDDAKPEYRYVLPQGSPCSPVLTNIICRTLDRRLNGLARRFQLRYSRYADDITFSSPHNVYHEDGEFLQELRRIIAGQNFTLNEKKTRLQKRGQRQEVTGLVVSDRVNVTREYVRSLDNLLYIWERYGHNAAFAKFLVRYTPKQDLFAYKPNMETVVAGRLMYLRMVKGEDSPVWRRLQKRFNRLVDRKENSNGTSIIYEHSYTISFFEKAFGTSVYLDIRKNDPEHGPRNPYFVLNGEPCSVELSRYARTRLTNILESGDKEKLQKFKEQYHIAYCHFENTDKYPFWMIKRRPPRKLDLVELMNVDDILKAIAEVAPAKGARSAPEIHADAPDVDTLTTDQVLDRLVESDFDLNTLEQWDKIRTSN